MNKFWIFYFAFGICIAISAFIYGYRQRREPNILMTLPFVCSFAWPLIFIILLLDNIHNHLKKRHDEANN